MVHTLSHLAGPSSCIPLGCISRPASKGWSCWATALGRGCNDSSSSIISTGPCNLHTAIDNDFGVRGSMTTVARPVLRCDFSRIGRAKVHGQGSKDPACTRM